MRLILPSLLCVILAIPAVQAQSIIDNLPGYGAPPAAPASPPAPSVTVIPAAPASSGEAPAAAPSDPYTVTDVNADVTADSAAHARDQALTQAERSAFQQLCARMNAGDMSKLNDDAIAAMVQSFEVQSEHLSAVRYIGVFTIRFKPSAVQRKFGKAAMIPDMSGGITGGEPKMQAGPTAHIPVTVDTPSLAVWAQIKRRLSSVPEVVRIDTIDLGRGVSHMDLLYSGSLEDLENAVTVQGFVLRQNAAGEWELTDGSIVPR